MVECGRQLFKNISRHDNLKLPLHQGQDQTLVAAIFSEKQHRKGWLKKRNRL